MSKARGLADLGNAFNDGALSNRNLVINGAMQVAQRGTSETGVTSSGYKTCDRFTLNLNALATWTVSQSADAPAGFASSLMLECTTADAAPAANSFLALRHVFEGQNLQQLKKGTAAALPLTLSFWVKCFKTGDFQVNLNDADNGRQLSSVITINSAATWEYKTATFAGDTVGAFNNDNERSMDLEFWLDVGSTYTGGAASTSWETIVAGNRAAGTTLALGDSTSNYFQITGVQLEVGDTATPFEHRSYGDELARCERYYQSSFVGNTGPSHDAIDCIYSFVKPFSGTSAAGMGERFRVQMRSTPTVTLWTTNPYSTTTSGRITYYDGSWKYGSANIHTSTSGDGFAMDGSFTSGMSLMQYNYEADAEL